MLYAARIAGEVGVTIPGQVRAADGIGDRVDRVIRAQWRAIGRLLERRPVDLQYRLARLIRELGNKVTEEVGNGLMDLTRRVHRDTVARLSRELPQSAASLAVQIKAQREGRPPAVMEDKATPEQAAQIREMLFPPLTREKAREVVYSSTNGTNWRRRMAEQTATAPPEQVAATVAQWASTGKTPAELRKALMPVVAGISTTARRIARTEGQRVAHEIRMESYKGIDPLIVGYQIHATMDQRTRPHHAARNGTVYYKDPKGGQPGLKDMPRPPLEEDGTVAHNCRCYLTPVLTEDNEILDNPETKKLFDDNEGNLVPDPNSYHDWFDTASAADRRWAVGSRRLSTMMDLLKPGESLSWAHFLDPKSGKLLDISQLKRETPEERAARVAMVQAELARRKELARQVHKYGFLIKPADQRAAEIAAQEPPKLPDGQSPGQLPPEPPKAVLNLPFGSGWTAAMTMAKAVDLHRMGWGTKEQGTKAAYGGVILDPTGRICLRKPTGNFDGYHWTFPKGKEKHGDHPAETAVREVEEETGHKGEIVGYLPGAYKSGSSTSYFYFMRSNGYDPAKQDSETEQVVWVTPEEAKELISQTTNTAGRERDLAILAEVEKHLEENKAGKPLPAVEKPAPKPKPFVEPGTWYRREIGEISTVALVFGRFNPMEQIQEVFRFKKYKKPGEPTQLVATSRVTDMSEVEGKVYGFELQPDKWTGHIPDKPTPKAPEPPKHKYPIGMTFINYMSASGSWMMRTVTGHLDNLKYEIGTSIIMNGSEHPMPADLLSENYLNGLTNASKHPTKQAAMDAINAVGAPKPASTPAPVSAPTPAGKPGVVFKLGSYDKFGIKTDKGEMIEVPLNQFPEPKEIADPKRWDFELGSPNHAKPAVSLVNEHGERVAYVPPLKKVPKVKPFKVEAKGFPRSSGSVEVVGSLGGSTGAKLVRDKAGAEYVMKKGVGEKQLRAEAAADALYAACGVAVPHSKVYEEKGGPVKLGKKLEGMELGKYLATCSPVEREAVLAKIHEGFAADALLGNWDVIGANHDNILVTPDGTPHRIDNGGALEFRAQGKPKNEGGEEHWGEFPVELWTLRGNVQKGQPVNEQSRSVFGNLSWDKVTEQMERLVNSREQILKAAGDDPERLKVLEKRMDQFKDIAATSRLMLNDGFTPEYVSEMVRNQVLIRKSGLINKVAKQLGNHTPVNGEATSSPVDANGKPFDNFRGFGSVQDELVELVNKNGGDWEGVISPWAGSQGSDSWASGPRAMKYMMTKWRPQTKDEDKWYWRRSQNECKMEFGGDNPEKEEKYLKSMAALHAWTQEVLRNVDMPNSNRAEGLMRLYRTEGDDVRQHYKVRAGEKDVMRKMKRGPMESYSAFKPFYMKPNLTTQEVPFHRIFASYLTSQNKTSSGDHTGMFLGDHENEMIAMVDSSIRVDWHGSIRGK